MYVNIYGEKKWITVQMEEAQVSLPWVFGGETADATNPPIHLLCAH